MSYTMVYRSVKGSPLTNTEVDTNFQNLDTYKAPLDSPAFTTLATLAGSFTATAATGAFIASNGGGTGQTSMQFKQVGAAADAKTWELLSNGTSGAFTLRAANDAYTASSNAIQVNRGTGYTLSYMQLMSGGGRVVVGTGADDGVNALQVTGGIAMNGQLSLTGSGQTIELGSTSAANTPAIDFHSSGNNISYDVRLISSGGTTNNGNGALQVLAGSIYWNIYGTNGMTLNTSGRLLVGTSADDSSGVLQVNGNISSVNGGTIQATNYGGNSQFLSRSASGTLAAPTTIPTATRVGSFIVSGYNGSAFSNVASIHAYSEEAYTTSTNATNLRFFTTPTGSITQSERLRITGSGRTLINQTSDDGIRTLQVTQGIANTNTSDGNPGLILTGTSGFSAGLHLLNNTASVGRKYSIYSNNTGSLAFGDETSAAIRMQIVPAGRVLVGGVADDGSSILQTAGAIRATGSVTGASASGALVATNGAGSGQTSIYLQRAGAGTDAKNWEVLHDGAGNFTVRTVNDAYSASTAVITVLRPSGYASTVMQLFPSGGRVLIGTSIDDGSSAVQANGIVTVNAPAVGTQYGFRWNVTGKIRWQAINDGAAESGSNAGSNWVLSRFNDAGTYLDNPITILRQTGQTFFSTRPSFNGATPWDTANLTPLDRNNGGQINNPITMYGSGDYGNPIIFNSNGYAPRIQAQASVGQLTIVNAANNAANLTVWDGGQVAVRGNLLVGGTTYTGGSNATIAPDGNVWGTQWGSQWLRTFLDNTYMRKSGDTMAGGLWTNNNITFNGYGSINWPSGVEIYQDNSGSGPGDLVIRTYNGSYYYTVFQNNGNLNVNAVCYANSFVAGGSATYQNDGNINGSLWGGYLSTYLSNTFVHSAWNNYFWTDNAHNYKVGWDGSQGHINFYIDGSGQAYITANWSDVRLKENIAATEEDSLSLVEQVDFKQFDFKSNGKHQDVGFIAQEVEEFAPSWVVTKNFDDAEIEDLRGMDTTAMLLSTMHALQQLSRKFDAMEMALDAANEKIAHLEEVLAAK